MIGPWAAAAACRNHPRIDWWFPGPSSGVQPDRGYANARNICNGCPVREQCLEHALTNGETDGMWGGLRPDERRPSSPSPARRGRPKANADHGTTARYRQGCTCADCRTAMAAYQRTRRHDLNPHRSQDIAS